MVGGMVESPPTPYLGGWVGTYYLSGHATLRFKCLDPLRVI